MNSEGRTPEQDKFSDTTKNDVGLNRHISPVNIHVQSPKYISG